MVKMISAKEASERLGISKQHVITLLREGKLIGEKVLKRYWSVDEDSVSNYIPGKVGRPMKKKKEVISE